VLLFLLEPNQIDKNIAGLIANKFMAKYQRPVCILTKNETPMGVAYQGSARGCDIVGVTNFKDICENTEVINFAAGHQGAFGLSIPEKNIDEFISRTDSALANMPNESLYYVDYIFNKNTIDPKKIIEISQMEDLWGKDVE
jgi:single-stranded-DNA-specific exonuclease